MVDLKICQCYPSLSAVTWCSDLGIFAHEHILCLECYASFHPACHPLKSHHGPPESGLSSMKLFPVALQKWCALEQLITLKQCTSMWLHCCYLCAISSLFPRWGWRPCVCVPSSTLMIILISTVPHRRPWFYSWVGKIPWRRDRLPTPVFWPGEIHGLYNPWGCKESDHDWATFTFTFARGVLTWLNEWSDELGKPESKKQGTDGVCTVCQPVSIIVYKSSNPCNCLKG